MHLFSFLFSSPPVVENLPRAKVVYEPLLDSFRIERNWFAVCESAEIFLNALWLGALQPHPAAQVAMIFITHVALTALYWIMSPHKDKPTSWKTKIVSERASDWYFLGF